MTLRGGDIKVGDEFVYLQYYRYMIDTPQKVVEIGPLVLSFTASSIVNFRCEAPLNDLGTGNGNLYDTSSQFDQITCYFSLVNGSLVRATLLKDSTVTNGAFTVSSTFVYSAFRNNANFAVKVFDRFVSTLECSTSDCWIVNYRKDDSSRVIHSVWPYDSPFNLSTSRFHIDAQTLLYQQQSSLSLQTC